MDTKKKCGVMSVECGVGSTVGFAHSPLSILHSTLNTQHSTLNTVSRSGQAVIEFCIGLIAFLAVVGGMFQLGRLGLARLETRVEATRIATERSMRSAAQTGVFSPSYIGRVEDGPDGYSYSVDDVAFGASEDEAYERIAARMRPDLVRGYAPQSTVAGVTDAYEMRVGMGLVQGVGSRFNIPVLPVVRTLLTNQDSIDIQTEVWMTRTGDLY